jgi:hypothetical protein
MTSYKAWVGLSKSAVIDALKTIHQGSPVKDEQLYHLDRTPCRLQDFMKPGRPLAVNFGSCT